jgi:CubicO group peptidase (beta-lactamase class C family)
MKTSAPEQVGFSAHRLQRIDAVMQRYIDRKRLAGIVTLVARRGSVVQFEKYGYQDLAARKPMALDTIFRIYSMTKPITSVALMMLYEHGLFQLKDPVSEFIPEFKTLKVWADEGELADLEREITIHDLLTHTAGLTYGDYEVTQMPVDKLYDQADLWSPDITNQELVRRITELPLAHQPGKVWHYSVATSVVGYIVELISGTSLGEFFRERIFGPLGMDDTGFSVPSAKIDRLATLYGPTEKGPLDVIEPDPWGCDFIDTRLQYGGGGLVATAGDYLRFAQLLLNKGELDGVRLLGRKTVELMTDNHLPPTLLPMVMMEPLPGLGFGLGFRVAMDIAQLGILGSVGEYGWGGMAGTAFWIDPQEQLIGILLLQYLPYGTLPTKSEFKTLVYQALVD